jgi:hypothetical protein
MEGNYLCFWDFFTDWVWWTRNRPMEDVVEALKNNGGGFFILERSRSLGRTEGVEVGPALLQNRQAGPDIHKAVRAILSAHSAWISN